MSEWIKNMAKAESECPSITAGCPNQVFQPGDTVRHRIKRHDDSDFVGWVDEVTETRGVGYTIRTIAVRWIGADDDPSGAITKHATEPTSQTPKSPASPPKSPPCSRTRRCTRA